MNVNTNYGGSDKIETIVNNLNVFCDIAFGPSDVRWQ